MDNLKSKTLSGAKWNLVENIASLGITFVVGIILAQILTPVEFGVIGIIMIFIAFGNSFIEVGFNAALIRKVNILPRDYNTVFWLSLAAGVLFFLLLWLFAPTIGRFFDQPHITSQIWVTGLMLPLGAASVVQRTKLTRAMNFKTQTYVVVVAAAVSGAIGISMAYTGYGVWSLVAQIVSRTAVQALLYWFMGGWVPRFEFSKESFKELFAFSSKLLGAAMLETLYRNIYNIVIGKTYSAASLGYYNRASAFSSLTAITISNVVQKVSFPALSTLQNEPERLKAAYRKMIKTTMLIVFALMLGMAASAEPLILSLIGPQWLPAVPLLQLLCLTEMFYPLHAINLNIVNVVGRSDIFLKLEIIKKIIAVPTIFVGIFWGLEQMLWSGVIVSALSYLLNAYYSAPLIGYSLREQLLDILPLIGVSVCIGAVMWSLSLFKWDSYLTLSLQIVVGLLLAVLVYSRLRLTEFLEIKSLFLEKNATFAGIKKG